MNFIESVESFFKKYATFIGRSSRSEYWYVFLFLCLLTIVLDFTEMILFGIEWTDTFVLGYIASFITLIPSLALGARRLHDINMSGWWQLISITIIGIIPLIYWFCKAGDERDNSYGSNPLKESS